MPVGNFTFVREALVMGNSDDPKELDIQSTAGPALQMPADVQIDTATSILLPQGTRLIIADMISGYIYAYTGVAGGPNITSGTGYYCREGRPRDIPVGKTGGTLHNALYVVPRA